MIRTFIILFILVFIARISKSQVNSDIYKTVVWQVTKNGLKDTSYLFGTCHSFTGKFFEYHPDIINILNKTQIIATEIDFSNNLIDLKALEVTDSMKWKNIATKEQYRRIKNYFTHRLSMNSYYIDNTDIYNLCLGFDEEASNFYVKYMFEDYSTDDHIDKYCSKYAQKKGKIVTGLEEIPLHVSYVKVLYCNCKNPSIDQMKQQINKLDSLIKIFKNNPYQYEHSDSTLLKNYFELNLDYQLDIIPFESEISNNLKVRNQLWLRKIESLFSTKSTFIAVGLYHLYFKNGLIRLLEEKGYKVEPITLKKSTNNKTNNLRRYNF